MDVHFKREGVGKIGENVAVKYLVGENYRIIKRNHRERFDEIDIIAIAEDRSMVFCEVKTIIRKNALSEFDLSPEDNMTSGKFRKISRVCRIFAGRHPELIDDEKGWRIDLIAIDLAEDGTAAAIRHYINIAAGIA